MLFRLLTQTKEALCIILFGDIETNPGPGPDHDQILNELREIRKDNNQYFKKLREDISECQTHKKKKWKRMIVSKKNCSSPVWFKHSMSITQELIPIYNTSVHKNKTKVSLNVVKCLCH